MMQDSQILPTWTLFASQTVFVVFWTLFRISRAH